MYCDDGNPWVERLNDEIQTDDDWFEKWDDESQSFLKRLSNETQKGESWFENVNLTTR